MRAQALNESWAGLSRRAVILVIIALVLTGCGEQARKAATQLTGGDPDRGKVTMSEIGCASCHTIPGVPGATGLVGPPLERMGSRAYIGGVLKNTPDNMIRWLEDPPGVDPLTAMPNLHLSESQARDLASYLYTLQ